MLTFINEQCIENFFSCLHKLIWARDGVDRIQGSRLISICDEIKVATIAINETKILEIKATIALHSDLKFKWQG